MAAVEQQQENPLVEGLERLPVHPTTLVIFGGTGDLAKRKLLPAIYNLAHEGSLPERFNLIGSSRGEMSDEEYREMARESIRFFTPPTAPASSPGMGGKTAQPAPDRHEDSDVRVVIEKPIGTNLAEAK